MKYSPSWSAVWVVAAAALLGCGEHRPHSDRRSKSTGTRTADPAKTKVNVAIAEAAATVNLPTTERTIKGTNAPDADSGGESIAVVVLDATLVVSGSAEVHEGPSPPGVATQTPAATPTPTPVPSATPTPSPAPTLTPSPTPRPSPTPTQRPATPTPTPTPTTPAPLPSMMEVFVNTLFNEILNRPPAIDITSHVDLGQRCGAAMLIHRFARSAEAHRRLRERMSLRYFGRVLEGAYWESAFAADGGWTWREQVEGMVSSDEFFNRAGHGLDHDYVIALYEFVLGRAHGSISEADITHWLSQGLTRAELAHAIVYSNEASRRLVATWYSDYYERTASTAEINSWATRLLAGGLYDDVLVAFLTTPEFFAKDQAPNVEVPPLASTCGSLTTVISIRIDGERTALVGDHLELPISGVLSDGRPIQLTQAAVWSLPGNVSDNGILRIEDGEVIAVGVGTTTITVSVGDITQTITITVRPSPEGCLHLPLSPSPTVSLEGHQLREFSFSGPTGPYVTGLNQARFTLARLPRNQNIDTMILRVLSSDLRGLDIRVDPRRTLDVETCTVSQTVEVLFELKAFNIIRVFHNQEADIRLHDDAGGLATVMVPFEFLADIPGSSAPPIHYQGSQGTTGALPQTW